MPPWTSQGRQISQILANTIKLLANQETMMTTLADIANQLTAMEAAGQQELALLQQLEQLAITLATDLKAALANNDPAALQAIADRLTADQQVIAQAAVTIQQTLDANQPPSGATPAGGAAP